jgi:hypothetical protein
MDIPYPHSRSFGFLASLARVFVNLLRNLHPPLPSGFEGVLLIVDLPNLRDLRKLLSHLQALLVTDLLELQSLFEVLVGCANNKLLDCSNDALTSQMCKCQR